MNIKAATAHLALPRWNTVTLDDARGVLVRCLEGGLWITQDGDRNDHVIDAGGSFRVDRDGVVVMQATRAAQLVIESPDQLPLEPWWDPFSRSGASTPEHRQ
jgi:hypothetical protein